LGVHRHRTTLRKPSVELPLGTAERVDVTLIERKVRVRQERIVREAAAFSLSWAPVWEPSGLVHCPEPSLLARKAQSVADVACLQSKAQKVSHVVSNDDLHLRKNVAF
jgi:hypothetical protein